MDLVTPDLGLLFWTGIVFCSLLFLLAKFAWKPILTAVNERGESIAEALELAEKTRDEMRALKAENDQILKQAKAERDEILKEAKEIAVSMVESAKNKSKVESQKIVDSARDSIRSEKAAAMAELKTHVAALSLEIAEKVIRTELSSDEKQKALANNLASDINMN
ncbi:MAG: F0F1 ATP synthase subunit B [Crocinitomicaceae bacterium]|jgi:F-type H+-transporting ATPase subunit b|tara:strand:- start:39055 stop:39549 length:495 start_codon:yes stop_codon:yes gene_type:complete